MMGENRHTSISSQSGSGLSILGIGNLDLLPT
jgi:hypothetical protein